MNQPHFKDNHAERVVPTTLAVYRNLRIGLGMTAVMLGAAIIIQSTYMQRPTGENCWQGALSEYFYTSAHSIFIAALLGLATLFFVYRGSCDTENALFKIAGIAAFVAALVPQQKVYIDRCTPLFVPKDFNVEAIVRPNLVAVVVALVLAWVITLFQRLYDERDNDGRRIRQKKSPGGNWARWFLWLVVLVGLIVLIFPKLDLLRYAHGAAGLLLLASSIATVFVTAFLANREDRPPRWKAFQCFYKCFYWVWAFVMLVTFVGIIVVQIVWSDFFQGLWGTYVEGAVLLEFFAYWVVQTFDLWDDPDRRYRLTENDQNRLAQEPVSEEGLDDTSLGAKVMSFL